jgi:ABC-type nitrate/sulfonate/bicarbonate transport system ATPase subunit
MIQIKDLYFSYTPDKPILNFANMTLEDGELLAVMGPSGCGKSTLLSLIAGLQKPAFGSMECNVRQIATVFQEPRLFPCLTVKENIRAILPKETDETVIREAMEFVELTDVGNQYPDELSGGMKSRVALARALAYGGDLFLLDEPFAALNEDLRRPLAEKLRNHLKKIGASAILITHQSADAEIFADRILTFASINQ